ncbi:hypothetical protein DI005_33240 [Prauserella sp. PE36]|uniref:hypothetical protein n=1 Tax=Prauserella sp. PE36 TaxID=1504709 RepID=UPI000DE3E721|nr:hypothetical protein [Prauserella sp. PE36]RBM12126.1 hypothetical protein DI005_33240 [Prauserella sp. PE36]
MSTFDVLRQYGTAALLRFAGAVVLFLVLHLVRIPLVLAARVLEVAMRRLDGFATRQASTPPRKPVNDFFAGSASTREGARVYA